MAAQGEIQQPQPQGVRFSAVNEEIEPPQNLQAIESLTGQDHMPKEELSDEAKEELRSLAMTLQKSKLQSQRMENFSFEPVSLPPSRAPSPSSGVHTPSGHIAHSAAASPRPSPPSSTMHSPPLTPHGSRSREAKTGSISSIGKRDNDPAMMTPSVSPPHDIPPTSIGEAGNEIRAPHGSARLPTSQSQASLRPKSVDAGTPAYPGQPSAAFVVGAGGDSQTPSQDGSPSSSMPGTPKQTSSRPYTPQGDAADAYNRAKKNVNTRNLDSIEARFLFGQRDPKNQKYIDSMTAQGTLPGRNYSDTSLKQENKRHSFFGGSDKSSAHNKHHDVKHGETEKPHGSMSELKRFFKIGGHKKDKEKEKRPSTSRSSTAEGDAMRSPSTQNSVNVPFADDHGLQSKYGKFGRVLGSGAGGSVRLMKRSSDGVTFAVKQFRSRHSYESEKEYNKKVTAEFCVGSTLHHGNIIETMDLVHEKGNWYVVMEYAPYDLFATVMTGKMNREEVACSTLQILHGVTYLHEMGLAHRDLKLDNVVVNEHGIMKIIDFGSAAVFRYPFEDEIVLAAGIVGSDPYLAPEVYDLSRYDPRPTDIWSLAIIFCCMSLRRFPWKAPRLSDNSYRLFIEPPDDVPRKPSERDIAEIAEQQAQRASVSEPASRQASDSTETASTHHHHHHRHHHGNGDTKSDPTTNEGAAQSSSQSTKSSTDASSGAVIKGPWRLLRLLPRESRHIISRMLEVDPTKRATLEEIHQDKWVTNTPTCRQEDGTEIIKATNHKHTLEAGSGAGAPPSKK